jgi:hypothetical protein
MNDNVHLAFPNSLTLEKYHTDHQLLQLLACPITLAFTAGPPTDTSAHFINDHCNDLTRLRRR